MKNKKIKLILLAITNPWNIVFTIVLLFSTICMIHENNVIKDYIKTKVTYVKDCKTFNICDDNYMYEVDGVKYGISPAFETIEKYRKNNYAYYNKENPGEAMMISSWKYLSILCILVFIISTISYIISLRK